MPFKYLSDISKDDCVVKNLFDNVRNLILIVGVFAAGKWRFSNLEHGGNLYVNYFLAIALCLVAFGLFFINSQNTRIKSPKLGETNISLNVWRNQCRDCYVYGSEVKFYLTIIVGNLANLSISRRMALLLND